MQVDILNSIKIPFWSVIIFSTLLSIFIDIPYGTFLTLGLLALSGLIRLISLKIDNSYQLKKINNNDFTITIIIAMTLFIIKNGSVFPFNLGEIAFIFVLIRIVLFK